MIDISNINLSKLAIYVILTLAAIPLNSCSVTKSKSDKYCQRFIEEKLGIKRVIKWKNRNRVNILLINNNSIQLTQGYNFVTHPISTMKMGLYLNIESKKNYSIQRIDTLIHENRVVTYKWKTLKKKSDWDETTTDLKGQLIHSYGHTWFIGQGHGNYVDVIIVDTLGNTLREWGTTNFNKKRFRK
jgi:hypothetical protein